MTQKKISPKGSKKVKPLHTPSIAESFRKLAANDQQLAINFFNLHNAAGFLYSQMSEDCKQYVEYCVNLSQEADKIEKENV